MSAAFFQLPIFTRAPFLISNLRLLTNVLIAESLEIFTQGIPMNAQWKEIHSQAKKTTKNLGDDYVHNGSFLFWSHCLHKAKEIGH